jgi:DNA repair protein RadC
MKVDYFTIPEITVSYKDNVKTSERMQVKSSKDIAKIMSVAFEECVEHHEEVSVLYLNRLNRVLGIQTVSKGGIHETSVDIRIILQTALKVHCTSIALSHCHPSGNLQPSRQDISLTKQIQAGCKAIGIELLDHVVITSESYSSFADEGLM